MELPTAERPSSLPGRETAHERFRGEDRRRLRWSVGLSIAVHALFALAWPGATLPVPEEEARSAGSSALELVALGTVRPPGEGLVAVSVRPDADAPASEGGEEASEERGGGAEGDPAGRDPRTEALERMASVSAAVLQRRPEAPSEPVPTEEEVDAEDDRRSDGAEREGDDLEIRTAASELEERLSEEELVDLERLSSLRPELAVVSLSNWLVVRNPSEVRRFLEERFHAGSRDEPRGTLSVSVWIDDDGSVEWAEINRSSGRPELDASAIELFEEVIAFGPARERGSDVPTAAIYWLEW